MLHLLKSRMVVSTACHRHGFAGISIKHQPVFLMSPQLVANVDQVGCEDSRMVSNHAPGIEHYPGKDPLVLGGDYLLHSSCSDKFLVSCRGHMHISAG